MDHTVPDHMLEFLVQDVGVKRILLENDIDDYALIEILNRHGYINLEEYL